MQDRLVVELQGNLWEIRRLARLIEDFGAYNKVPETAIAHINLALDELLTNTISYGFDDAATDHRITASLRLEAGVLTAELVDDGKPFDPFKRADPNLSEPVGSRAIGGLGVFLVRKLMDEVDYRRVNGENRVTVIKRTNVSTA
jgi:serine/threonine-protein kinase RsbW